MIICLDEGTLTRYTVKPTLDGKWSIFRRNLAKGKGWKRVKTALIWENPMFAAADLIKFGTKSRYRMWIEVKDPDTPGMDTYKGTPDLMDLIPEEAKAVIKDENDIDRN